MVVRAGAGALRSSGPHHSGIYHPVFAHMPGLVVCVPVDAGRRQGADEDRAAGRRPGDHARAEGAFRLQGARCRWASTTCRSAWRGSRARATRLTIVAAGQMVPLALEAAEALAAEGIEAEVIDLRTIMPLDVATIVGSLRKTHRLLVVDEAWAMCGIGAEIAPGDQRARLRRARRAGRPAAPVRRPRIPSRRCWSGRCWSTPPASSRRPAQVLAGIAPVPDHWRAPGLAAAPALPASPPAAADAPLPRRRAARCAADEVEITMPFGDLTVSEGRVVAWLKAVGDAVDAGEMRRRDRDRQGGGRDRGARRRQPRQRSTPPSVPSSRWVAASAGFAARKGDGPGGGLTQPRCYR